MNEIWQKTVQKLASHLPSHTFNTWIKPMTYAGEEGHAICLEVPNSFYKDRIQSTYANLIRKELQLISNDVNRDISFVLPKKNATLNQETLKKISFEKAALQREGSADATLTKKKATQLNHKYNFTSFVVGNNNQFAHAASKAVAEKPGQQYNPLFIYGGVGLGKTHLLCAIGNEFLKKYPKKDVIYCSSEQFTNQLIQSIRHQKTLEFRKYFRESCDMLLIDDIQFLSGKERTQEEFFHTFNVLHQLNIQIVVTSDRMPRDIQDIDDRLRSRFEMGLLCDIQPADFETRMAILRKKSAEVGLFFQDDVCEDIAKRFPENIRSLEGALVRLSAHASLSDTPIDLEYIEKIFGPTQLKRQVRVEDIIKKVAAFYHIEVSDIKSGSRKKLVAQPRQIAMYIARKRSQLSFPELGEKFGGKDHTTVMHAVKKIEMAIKTDASLNHSIQAIESQL